MSLWRRLKNLFCGKKQTIESLLVENRLKQLKENAARLEIARCIAQRLALMPDSYEPFIVIGAKIPGEPGIYLNSAITGESFAERDYRVLGVILYSKGATGSGDLSAANLDAAKRKILEELTQKGGGHGQD